MSDSGKTSNVVLMGSVKSGKSSLAASLRRCSNGMHGLPDAIRVTISEDDTAFAGRTSSQPAPGELVWQRKLSELIKDRGDGIDFELEATPDDFILVYPLNLGLSHRTRGANFTRTPLPSKVRLIDAAGGLSLPSDRVVSNQQIDGGAGVSARKLAYRDLVRSADGVIFCIDVTSDDAQDWATSFDEMVETLSYFPDDQARRRIAIAFTKTEYLFSLDGRTAIFNALNREVVKRRIRRALDVTTSPDATAILKRCVDLEAQMRGRFEVRCFPTSVYGYLRHNGCANYSHASNKWLIGERMLYEDIGVLTPLSEEESRDPEEIDRRYARLWCPVLTIDPLVYAACGNVSEIESKFMFKIDDFINLVPVDESDDEEQRTSRRRKGKGWRPW